MERRGITVALSRTIRDATGDSTASAGRVAWYENFTELLEAAAGADAVWVRPTDLSPAQWQQLLDHARTLRWLHFSRVGVDALPLDDIARRGILLTNGRGLSARPIAEHVAMCMLAVRRGFAGLLRAQWDHVWAPDRARLDLLAGTAALILGYGHVGQAVARCLRTFDVRVTPVKRQKDPAADDVITGPSWTEMLPAVDWLILCLPLTASTRGLIGAPQLARMRRTAVLVNVARGEIVDENALIRALSAGELGGAILDTFAEEPLPKASPLWQLPNTVITPHVAWRAASFVRDEADLFLDNLERFVEGQPLRNVVDPKAGY